MKNRINVTLNGIPYTLLTDLKEEEAYEIIEYVDDFISSVGQKYENIARLPLAQLASLNIAEEMFQIKKDLEAEKEKSEQIQQDQSRYFLKMEEQKNEIEDLKRKLFDKDKKLEDAQNKFISASKKIGSLEKTLSDQNEEIITYLDENNKLELDFIKCQKENKELKKMLEEI